MQKKRIETRLPKRPSDPTNTGGLRRSYQKQIYGLYISFNSHLQPRIERLLSRVNTQYAVTELLNPGWLKDFIDRINDTESAIIKAGSYKIIDSHITRAYKRGKEVAVGNPRIRQGSITIDSRLSRTDELALQDLKARNFSLINDDSIKKKLLSVITDDIRIGKGAEAMARDIRDNILDIGMARSRTIARTEIAYSYNSAIAKTYQDANIEQWQWLSAMGENTCNDCSSRHGNIYDWKDEQPPIHPNCLCTIYPIVDRGFTI